MDKLLAWLWALSFVCLLLELIPRTADSRSVVPKFLFCDRYMYLYCCEPNSHSRVCPVRSDVA